MFKSGTREHLCLIKSASALFCPKEGDWNNQNPRRAIDLKVLKTGRQQPSQRVSSRFDLLVLQEMNQSSQCAVIAAIGICAHKSWGLAAAHPAKHRFLLVLENVYRLAANVTADYVKTLNGMNAGGANGKS